MSSININNDIFSKNLPKSISKISDSIFLNIKTNVKNTFTDVFNDTEHWAIEVSNEDTLSNSISVMVEYGHIIATGNDQKFLATNIFPVYINLYHKTIKFSQENINLETKGPYFEFLQKITTIINNNSLYDAINDNITTLSDISNSLSVKVLVPNENYGTCDPLDSTYALYLIGPYENLYPKNTYLTISVTPNEHYNFIGWFKNGINVSYKTSYSFIVNNCLAFMPKFEPVPYTVSVTQVPEGSYFTPKRVYYYNDTATVETIPSYSYAFECWKVDNTTVSQNNPYSFTVDKDVVFTPVFKPIVENTPQNHESLNTNSPKEPEEGDTKPKEGDERENDQLVDNQ